MPPPDHVPVFPLPDVVLFPRQLLPLHIFEPRYREMTRDILDGHRCVAAALLRPGFEPQYFTPCAPIHPIVGVGRIVAAEPLKDGRFNILLRGIARARIVSECHQRPYRVARIQVIQPCVDANGNTQAELRGRLHEAVQCSALCDHDHREKVLSLFETHLHLGDLVDVIGACLPVSGQLRQCLLNEPRVCTRAEMLIRQLETCTKLRRTARKLQPDGTWSMN